MNSLSRRFADFSNQSGRKNALMNGKMDIWQRGTSFIPIVNNKYSADRWLYGKTGTMVHSITQSTNVPTFAQANTIFNYSLQLALTTPDVSIAAADFTSLLQVIEGNNFYPIHQKPLVLSFWVKAAITGTYCCFFRNGALQNRSLVMEYTINLSNTWEYKEIRIPATPTANGIDNAAVPAPGTWQTDTKEGLDVGFTLAGGTTYQTTPGIWQTGNFFSTTNQVNGVAAVGNFNLAGIQLEVGNIATPLEYRTFQDELALCQRYFEAGVIFQSYAPNNTLLTNEHFVEFRVTKRDLCTLAASLRLAPPTGSNLAAFTVFNAATGAPIILAPAQVAGFVIGWQSVNGADTAITGNWTADCDY